MSKLVVAGVSVVVVLTVLGLGLNLLEKGIQIQHWWDIGFQMISYHPWIPILGLIGVVVYFAIAWITGAHWYFYVIGGAWLVYDIIMLYGIYFA